MPTRGQERTAEVAPKRHFQQKLPLSEEANRVGDDEILIPTATPNSPKSALILLPLYRGPPVDGHEYVIGLQPRAKLPSWTIGKYSQQKVMRDRQSQLARYDLSCGKTDYDLQ